MLLLDAPRISRLQVEFRQSMRALLAALCDDIEHNYADHADRLDLPVGYFRFLARSLDLTMYSNWKVVGWIEALNDLVYFLDLLAQIKQEGDRRTFAQELFAECEDKFFENSYLEELFPGGQAQSTGLEGRLRRLCMRLSLDITQESLCIDPRRALDWIHGRRRASWTVRASLEPSFERAEAAYTVPVGVDGGALIAPASVRKAIGPPSRRATFLMRGNEIALQAGRSFPLCQVRGAVMHWHWPFRQATPAIAGSWGCVSVGPTLRYGRNREPNALSATDPKQIARIGRAWLAIERAWPEGHALMTLLTSRVIPLRAPGVVSFSYRHRPGLSFVNCFDRDNLDLIDDLIHENSHHHLNLLLRKHVLYRGDRNQQIFYSPWRRSLRPIRGILHAAFTFTMGALLFARLSTWADTREGQIQWTQAGLTARHLIRARFRCLEEIESVRYSLHDLEYAGRHLKWITASGARLVNQLEEAIVQAEQAVSRHRRAVLASSYGASLQQHISELRGARRTYGPMSFDQA